MTLIDISEALSYKRYDPIPIMRKVTSSKKGAKIVRRRLLWNTKLPLSERIEILLRYISYRLRGKITTPLIPDEEHLLYEELNLSVHSGTHIDAPFHYGSQCAGQPSKTIDVFPLSLFYHDGVLIDMNHKQPNEKITKRDITDYLRKIAYDLKPFDIVLIRTGWDKKKGTAEYLQNPGLTEKALEYILSFGVRIVGIDCLSLDRGTLSMLRDFYQEFDNTCLWPVHYYGRKSEYLQIERLAHLDMIPKYYGFKVACFPIKVKKGSAAWSRVVVIV